MNVEWSAPEYEHRPKEASWFWISIIIAVFVIAFAVWQKNFLFGFFVVVAEILLLVWGNREPREVRFSISDKGLTVDERKFYSWSQIENWRALELERLGYYEIVFDFKAKLRPNMRLLLPEDKFAEAKKILSEFLPEAEWEDSFIDSLERFLGF